MKKKWIVTASSDRPINDIAKDLDDVGLKDVRVLREIGSIIGSAEDETASKLRKVRGVMDVSPDISIDIGPPDSKETW
jgi:hypothetical protein